MTGTNLPYYRSLYFRLGLAFAVTLGLAGILQLFVAASGFQSLSQEIAQQLNWDVAAEIANSAQPTILSGSEDEIKEKLFELILSAPDLEIYLLDNSGKILLRVPETAPIVRTTVSLEPLKKALGDFSTVLPIYGDDPIYVNRSKTFSVAPIKLSSGEFGYLYAILNSSTFTKLSEFSGQFFLTRTVIFGSLLVLAIAFLVGWFAFRYLTSRFYTLTEIVRGFAQADFSKRVPPGPEDEIGLLATSVNAMADAIEISRQALQEQDQLRRELVASISHDLRSPVGAIRSNLETVLEKHHETLPADARQLVQNALRSSRMQDSLVDDLFELSALEAKEQQAEFDVLELKKLIEQIVETTRPVAARAGLELEAIVSTTVHVLADPKLISRALTNLMDNAIKHTPEGGKIKVCLDEVGNQRARLSVIDSGQGIPDSEQELIFSKFYQGSKALRGVGLGLSIVKRIAELHGSKLSLTSSPGKGSSFFFELSIAE